MKKSISSAFAHNFLGRSPNWYKALISLFLVVNPIAFYLNPFAAGWILVAEFIFTLAMALKCYPLQAGGLLAIEAVFIGMTTPESVQHELVANIEVILLLMFMVAGIHFMKDLLLLVFTKILVKVRSKVLLSLSFCFASAFLSAFLDALTVIAVVISVAGGFYNIYHKVVSDKEHSCDVTKAELQEYRGFLRSIMMHSGIGSALGGVMTMVGEPQNLIIAEQANWHFGEFILRMLPITLPVLVMGLLTVVVVEKMKIFGYGDKLPENVYKILSHHDQVSSGNRTRVETLKLVVQGIVGVWLIIGLAMHLASVGLIGLTVIVLITAFVGITDEHHLGDAFKEALPFTALLAVFFTIVAVIIDQQLFKPVIETVLKADGDIQMLMFFVANGVLSMVSDNVFVGTVYINEVKSALTSGVINLKQFEGLAVAINAGTNLPSIATPNGQAAFLFLLTSSLAPVIQLSYGRMVKMAIPFTVVMTATAIGAIVYLYHPLTDYMEHYGLIVSHAVSVGGVSH